MSSELNIISKLQFVMNFVHHMRHRGFFMKIMNTGQPFGLNPFHN